MDLTTPTDKFGREIRAGQTLVYPVRRRSVVSLKAAKVTGYEDGVISATSIDSIDGRQISIKLRNPERCAIVEVS